MAGTGKDFWNALRQLGKDPGFTAVAVLMLGIYANSTVFSWINATMLHPIPGARQAYAISSADLRRKEGANGGAHFACCECT